MLGRPRGGFGTKRHVVSEVLVLPLRFEAGLGFEHDMKQAHGLIKGLQAKDVLADKAYDADSLIQTSTIIMPRPISRLKPTVLNNAPTTKISIRSAISSNLCSANSSKHAWDPSNAPQYIYSSNS